MKTLPFLFWIVAVSFPLLGYANDDEYEKLVQQLEGSTAEMIDALQQLIEGYADYSNNMLRTVEGCSSLDGASGFLAELLAENRHPGALKFLKDRALNQRDLGVAPRLAHANLLKHYSWSQVSDTLRAVIKKDGALRADVYPILEKFGKTPDVEWVKCGIREDFWAGREMNYEKGVLFLNEIQEGEGTLVLTRAVEEQLRDHPVGRFFTLSRTLQFLFALGEIGLVEVLLDHVEDTDNSEPFHRLVASSLNGWFGGNVIDGANVPDDAHTLLRTKWNSIRDGAVFDVEKRRFQQ